MYTEHCIHVHWTEAVRGDTISATPLSVTTIKDRVAEATAERSYRTKGRIAKATAKGRITKATTKDRIAKDT